MTIRQRIRNTDIYFILLITIYAYFNFSFFNTFFPITEGWFQDYAQYIKEGQIMYRDFYMFIPPGFPWLMTIISYISDNHFITYRIYGILERILLISIFYFLMRKQFSKQVCFISILTSSIIYISNLQDIFYGYYQSSLLLVILSVFFFSKFYENIEEKPEKYSILCGLFLGLTFIFKHTTGVVLPIIFLFLLLIFPHKNNKKWSQCIIFMFFAYFLVVLLLIIYLYLNSALGPFIKQTLNGGSSKGTFFHILSRGLTGCIKKSVLIITFLFFISYLLEQYNKYLKLKNVKHVKYEKYFELALTLFYSFLFIYTFYYFMNYTVDNYLFTTLVIATATLAIYQFYTIKRNNKLFINKISDKQSLGLFFIGSIILILLMSNITKLDIIYQYCMHIFIFRNSILVFVLFNILTIYCVILIFQILIFKNFSAVNLCILAIPSWILMYIHSWSNTIEDHACLLPLAFFIALYLSNTNNFNHKIYNKIYLTIFCIFMILSVYAQKTFLPYHWWGVNGISSVSDNTTEFTVPQLNGIYGTKKYVKNLETLYNLILKNRQDGESLYTFPHMTFFNVITKMKSTTFAKVHYFDVCPDEIAIKDANEILQNPPEMILWLDLPESAWQIHEQIFRNGNLSGQRKILKTIKYLIMNKKYRLLGIFNLDNSDPIYFYKKLK